VFEDKKDDKDKAAAKGKGKTKAKSARPTGTTPKTAGAKAADNKQ